MMSRETITETRVVQTLKWEMLKINTMLTFRVHLLYILIIHNPMQ